MKRREHWAVQRGYWTGVVVGMLIVALPLRGWSLWQQFLTWAILVVPATACLLGREERLWRAWKQRRDHSC